MKHIHFILVILLTFSAIQVQAFATLGTKAGTQSTALENEQNAQTPITEAAEVDPSSTAVAKSDSTVSKAPPAPLGNMFHQVVDWLYPKQKENK